MHREQLDGDRIFVIFQRGRSTLTGIANDRSRLSEAGLVWWWESFEPHILEDLDWRSPQPLTWSSSVEPIDFDDANVRSGASSITLPKSKFKDSKTRLRFLVFEIVFDFGAKDVG